jgi:hypothetical protein
MSLESAPAFAAVSLAQGGVEETPVIDCGKTKQKQSAEGANTSGELKYKQSAKPCDFKKCGMHLAASRQDWPKVDPSSPYWKILKMSPVKILPQEPIDYLQRLYPETRLICLGKGLHSCTTELLASFPEPLEKYSVIVPSYMTSRFGQLKETNADGSKSRGPRCNANTGHPRYLVFQSETLTVEEQVRAIKDLGRKAKLVLVVRVGRKRIEGWFSAKKLNPTNLRSLRCYAAAIGAPKSVFFDCHPYGLPQGTGEQGKRNSVLYWDPSAA